MIKKPTTEEIQLKLNEARSVYMDSSFEFLKSHNGLRPGAIHTFIGNTSAGKSTLVRSIVTDCLFALKETKKSIIVLLSEETEMDFAVELLKSGIDYSKEKRLIVFSEIEVLDIKYNPKGIIPFLKMRCMAYNAGVLIYDNLTTSKLYEGKNPREQFEKTYELKDLAIEYKLPLIAVLHTGAGVTENLNRQINMNDVRSAKSIANLSNFFYIMQTFDIGDTRIPTITITKNRGQNLNSGKFFILKYYPEGFIFSADKKSTFEEFKEIYKQRNNINSAKKEN